MTFVKRFTEEMDQVFGNFKYFLRKESFLSWKLKEWKMTNRNWISRQRWKIINKKTAFIFEAFNLSEPRNWNWFCFVDSSMPSRNFTDSLDSRKLPLEANLMEKWQKRSRFNLSKFQLDVTFRLNSIALPLRWSPIRWITISSGDYCHLLTVIKALRIVFSL